MEVATLVAVLVVSCWVTGCASPTTGHPVGWRTLSRGLTSGLTQSMREVVRDEVTYFKLWADHAADANRLALPPTVDFTREMVLVVALGNRPTGGYTVEIVDMELRGRTLHVQVGERTPSPGAMQIQQITQPFQMVALPAMNARVSFHDVREARHPSGSRRARPGQAGNTAGTVP
jgi:hypothetical protein